MTRLGMDVDQVESTGKELKARSQEIDALVTKVDGIVRKLPGVWDGPDSQQFVNEWWPEHRKTLVHVSTSVAGLGQSAMNNASEQREASTGGGGSSGGGDNDGVGGGVLRLGVYGAVGGEAKASAADRYDLTRSTSDDSDGVRIQGVMGADNHLRYVVYLSGTVPSRLDDRGIAENIAALGVNTSTYDHLVQKMISQIQPPDSKIMIVGYSQGGIHAQLLAGSGKFNVTDVMTYGSPNLGSVDSHSDYNIVRIQDVDDNIPKLAPDGVVAAWRAIQGNDAGIVKMLAPNDNLHDQTYDTDTSVAGELGIGTHGKDETYREGGNQYELLAQSTPEGRDALASQSRYSGTIVSDSTDSDGPVFVDNTWVSRY